MTIVCFSDLHGNHQFYEWISCQVNKLNPDLIAICGDLFGYSDQYYSIESAQEADAKKLESVLARISIPVLYIMGNDDFISFRPVAENIFHLHGKSFMLNEYNFIGYEYSLPFVGGIFEKPENEICSDLHGISKLISDHTILISHSPAYGILDQTLSGINCGSTEILNFIQTHKIYAHIHGHNHEAFGNSGIHFNCAAAGKHRAMLINLDTLSFDILE